MTKYLIEYRSPTTGNYHPVLQPRSVWSRQQLEDHYNSNIDRWKSGDFIASSLVPVTIKTKIEISIEECR